jgi:hypothetical protein
MSEISSLFEFLRKDVARPRWWVYRATFVVVSEGLRAIYEIVRLIG